MPRVDTAAAGMRLCPACGEENPAPFRHCGMCGTDARSTAARPATAARPSRSSSRTRSPPPSTATTPSPEALRDVMTRYFEAMRVPLERHGGTVEKFIGDAVMAVFGLPVRHEDDARPGDPCGGGDAGRPPRPQRRVPADLGDGDQQPYRGQHGRGDRRRREPRPATGDRRRGQHGGPARAGRRRGRDRPRRVDLSPGARPDRGRGHPSAHPQGQGRAGTPPSGWSTVRSARRERASVTTPFVGREVEMYAARD